MGGTSSKQESGKSQPPSQNLHSLPTNSTAAAWNPSVYNRPTSSFGSVREVNQQNTLPSQGVAKVTTEQLAASLKRVAPQPPALRQTSAPPVELPRRLPPLQATSNTTLYNSSVVQQPATPKPVVPKPRATISPLVNNVHHPALSETRVKHQQQKAMATTSTSSLMNASFPEFYDETQRFLDSISLNSPKPSLKVKRLQNSQAAGVSVRRVGSFAENSAPLQPVAGAGRKTTAGKMPPTYQVENQIRHLLRSYKDIQSSAKGEFIQVNYQKLMLYYNENILEKDPLVSYGNALSIMRKNAIIFPPQPKQSQTVIFSRQKVAEFLQTNGYKAGHIKNGVTNYNVKKEWKKKPDHLNVAALKSQSPEPTVTKGWNGPRTPMKAAASTYKNAGKRNPFNNKCADCGSTNDENHLDSDEHLFAVQYKKFSRSQSRADKDAGAPPNQLSGKMHSLLFQSKAAKEGFGQLLLNFIKNSKNRENIALELILFKCPENVSISNVSSFIIGSDKLCFSQVDRLQLSEKKTYARVVMQYDASSTCFEEFIIVLKFRKTTKNCTDSESFFVMKKISVRCDDDSTREDGEVIRSKPAVLSEDSKDEKQVVCEELMEDDVEIQKPKSQMRIVNKLEEYPIPEQYIELFNSGLKTDDKSWTKTLILQSKILDDLTTGLCVENYSKFFSLLLFMEEHQTIADLKEYTMKDVKPRKVKDMLEIEVPGLAENRPSVLKYDDIFLTLPTGKQFRGTVKNLQSTKISVQMGTNFNKLFLDNMKVTVRFSFNRNCLRAQHRALEMMVKSKTVQNVCFPKSFGLFEEKFPIMSWYNPLVGKNAEQSQAVQNIVDGTSKPAPYLVFGPPGTGKTVTIVESIKQIYRMHENSHILASAPSNSAADLLAERILQSLPASEVLRLYSPSRDFSQVPESLKRSCNFERLESYIPDRATLQKYRVIICTLICAGRLVTGGFPSGHFSHIFVDECGHAMEPTALVPIAGLQGPVHKPSQIVLSGDPRQLGSVVRSAVALQLGLGVSLLGRLMDTVDLYQRIDNKFNPLVLTKLVANFRSHPAILKVPNELFYESDLISKGEEMITHSATDWDYLPRKGFPMIFHGVQGKEDTDQSSPSYFNISEVAEVVKYAEKILDSKFCGQKLRPADIGIVSPYRGQLSKIHRALERKKLGGISTGSVEEFQGQERRVIIISTVRSDPLRLKIDRKFRIGFVKEPKRFNVAVTRAKSLLIIIGNPYLLESDFNWCYMLRHIWTNGGYTGCKYVHDVNKPLPEVDDHSKRESSKVLNNFQKLLNKNNQVMADLNAAEKENAFATDSTIDDLMDQLKQISFFTEGSSAVEKYVSPPMTMFEQ